MMGTNGEGHMQCICASAQVGLMVATAWLERLEILHGHPASPIWLYTSSPSTITEHEFLVCRL